MASSLAKWGGPPGCVGLVGRLFKLLSFPGYAECGVSFKKSTPRLIAGIALLLVFSFTGTGFITSKYRTEKLLLGRGHYDRGIHLQHGGEINDAVEEFRKALIFCPDTAEYRVSFAAALIEAGKLDEAESHLEQLLQEDPTNGELNLMFGRIAVRRNRLSKAIEYYQRAVYEYWPTDRVGERRKARLELIDLLAKSGRRDELIGELMTLYANFPNDQPLRSRIGLDLLDHGAVSESTQVFRELVRISPKNAEYHRGLAQAYFASGDYVSARHEFERTLRLNPKDGFSATQLKLTNSVIDLDPNLIGIREAERTRRAQNLLRRVKTDLEQCSEPGALTDPLNTADKLLAGQPSADDDLAGDMQKTALDIWSKRGQFCAGKPTSDGPLATVLARMANKDLP